MRLLGLICAATLGAAIDPYKLGLANPRGFFASKSALWVAEAGNGAAYGTTTSCGFGAEPGIGCLGYSGRISAYFYDSLFGEIQGFVDGLPSWAGANTSANAIGVHDVHVDEDGIWYITGGLATPNTPSFELSNLGCKLFKSNATDTYLIADFYDYEWANNPDEGGLDCDPYRFERDQDGSFLVTDAAANAILRADVDGSIETVAVWGKKDGAEAVPTGIALGQDGEIFVGNLGGFPFTTDASELRAYKADGSFEIVAVNFTTITDVAVDAYGNIWVLEMSPSLLTLGPTVLPAGTLSRIDGQTWEKTKFLNHGEILLANGLAVAPDGDIYIGSETLGGNAFVNCPSMCENSAKLIKWTPPAYTPPTNGEGTGTVINFNFAGLFNGINNPMRR